MENSIDVEGILGISDDHLEVSEQFQHVADEGQPRVQYTVQPQKVYPQTGAMEQRTIALLGWLLLLLVLLFALKRKSLEE
ncbi:hypothetical protein NRIC_32020 [Enterococcus florum]|uniref:Uncharacterized protein n=1 Tax=Enterococcus florum TaxID=2480627 RepID=A0A4P5PFW2_9ENTE|nr:LPXTG cell wall anchor domain-containing protein [Enterococcus florum]GCF95311.1 hypothetical protein NRIC_32020 [Enterococcus florum]